MELIEIDGAQGEGGGQILRSSLSLSLVSGAPIRVTGIRAGRRRPGLMRQHLTAVQAAARIGGARVEGAEAGSTELVFEPATIAPGHYEFSVGTAGSTTLVLQTILPALWTASGPSEIRLSGGTHNPMAPPFDFLDRAFLPLVRAMGPQVHAQLVRPGFFPAGGGEIAVQVQPVAELRRLDLMQRGDLLRRRAVATVAHLGESIARRELRVIGEQLGFDRPELIVEKVDAAGAGNLVRIEFEAEHVCELFTGFGARGVRAEKVAQDAVRQARRWLDSGAPVGEMLADQLLLPMALAGGGRFTTTRPSSHTRTNARTISRFLPIDVEFRERGPAWEVELRPR